ncbi:MAG: nucleotidyltransferase domain-containing protein [Deltaproteobacteria bacterium]|nr:nucleotidyltransferase domain-containing protein [Deltaproteobacteria bacterium]
MDVATAVASGGRAPCAEADRRLAAEFARRLADAVGGVPFRVTLYGSRARGDAEPGSDLDLFVAVGLDRMPAAFREAARATAAELTLDSGILVSLFLADNDYVRTHEGWSLLRAVAAEGVSVNHSWQHERSRGR